MKRILYFDWWHGGTEFYRLYPMDYIKNPDLTIVRSEENNPKWELIDRFDTIIISRPSTQDSIKIIKLARQLHKRVIADFDDDPLHLDQYNPLFFMYRDHKPNLIECVSLCDEVWAATQGIKDAFRLYNNNIHIIPNAHDDYQFPVHAKKEFNHNKIATWRGGESHEGDIYDHFIPELIIRIVADNPKWRFHFFGQRFKYLEKRCGNNYIACGGHPNTIHFHKMMHENNSQLFFYPLSNTVFNRSKSNCSWLESSYAGSAFFGNIDLPEFQMPGISSLKLLEKAIGENHVKYMKEQNEKSWQYIKENLLVSIINKKREDCLLV